MIVQTRKKGVDIEINNSIMENSTVFPFCATDLQWSVVFNLGSSWGKKTMYLNFVVVIVNSALPKYFLAFLHFRYKTVISSLREAQGEF